MTGMICSSFSNSCHRAESIESSTMFAPRSTRSTNVFQHDNAQGSPDLNPTECRLHPRPSRLTSVLDFAISSVTGCAHSHVSKSSGKPSQKS